jgi:hypothetical protein
MVPRRGLEPPRGCPHQHLKLACLPISPPRQRLAVKAKVSAHYTYPLCFCQLSAKFLYKLK